MNKNKNITINFYDCCPDEWMIPFIEELLSHIELPNKETILNIYEIDERGISMQFESIEGSDLDDEEDEDCIEAYIRYWIDEIWPDFCVSYQFYFDGNDVDEGGYRIVRQNGEDKCISIEY